MCRCHHNLNRFFGRAIKPPHFRHISTIPSNGTIEDSRTVEDSSGGNAPASSPSMEGFLMPARTARLEERRVSGLLGKEEMPAQRWIKLAAELDHHNGRSFTGNILPACVVRIRHSHLGPIFQRFSPSIGAISHFLSGATPQIVDIQSIIGILRKSRFSRYILFTQI